MGISSCPTHTALTAANQLESEVGVCGRLPRLRLTFFPSQGIILFGASLWRRSVGGLSVRVGFRRCASYLRMRPLNKFLTLTFAFILMGGNAWADPAASTVNVVASCGSHNGSTYVAGQIRPMTQDTTGKLCGSH